MSDYGKICCRPRNYGFPTLAHKYRGTALIYKLDIPQPLKIEFSWEPQEWTCPKYGDTHSVGCLVSVRNSGYDETAINPWTVTTGGGNRNYLLLEGLHEITLTPRINCSDDSWKDVVVAVTVKLTQGNNEIVMSKDVSASRNEPGRVRYMIRNGRAQWLF